jgi:PDZ domain-containing protein
MRLVRLITPLLVGLLLLTAVGVGTQQANESVLVGPGPARPIGPMLKVDGHTPPEARSLLYLTSVAIDSNVSFVEWVGARLGIEGELQPATRLRPHGMSSETYGEISRHLLDESTEVAKIVALRRAGYPVEVHDNGAVVTAVLPGRPAEGILKVRDRITAVDGTPVATAAAAGTAIRGRAVGEPVRLTVDRGGTISDLTAATTAAPQTPDQATIGISVTTDTTVSGQPFEIGVDAGNLGGPSAGLMFTLAMLDALGETSLSHGQRVAGTGTINLDEEVGPIDGVRHKVKGAERAGARYFLAPRDNSDEARAAASSVRVVEVNTLQEALDFLATLPAA